MRNLAKVLMVVLALVPAAMVVAETTTEIRSGTVVTTFGDQLVVKLPSGEVKEITVPPGFLFNVDGRQVGLHELQPGTHLTATIKTTKTPQTVRTTKIKNGEVVRVTGNTLIVRENGEMKSYQIPADFKFNLDGQEVPISNLRPGYKLSAEIVYKSEHTVTTTERAVAGNSPPPPPAPTPAYTAPEPAPAPAPEPAPAPQLPKTASPLPLIGVIGAILLASGLAVRRARS